MTIFYSKSTKGFYDSDIHGDKIPKDAVTISSDVHRELLAGESEGKIINADDKGYPFLSNAPALSEKELNDAHNVSIIKEIEEIERLEQPRAMRDLLLDGDSTYLTDIETRIKDLRSQLK